MDFRIESNFEFGGGHEWEEMKNSTTKKNLFLPSIYPEIHAQDEVR